MKTNRARQVQFRNIFLKEQWGICPWGVNLLCCRQNKISNVKVEPYSNLEVIGNNSHLGKAGFFYKQGEVSAFMH